MGCRLQDEDLKLRLVYNWNVPSFSMPLSLYPPWKPFFRCETDTKIISSPGNLNPLTFLVRTTQLPKKTFRLSQGLLQDRGLSQQAGIEISHERLRHSGLHL